MSAPLRYQHLTDIIFENFHHIQKYIKRPLIIKLDYPTLHKQLVRAQYTLTDEQLIDILLMLPEQQEFQSNLIILS